jgi:hypothetical protein
VWRVEPASNIYIDDSPVILEFLPLPCPILSILRRIFIVTRGHLSLWIRSFLVVPFRVGWEENKLLVAMGYNSSIWEGPRNTGGIVVEIAIVRTPFLLV